MALSKRHQDILETRGLDPEILARYGVESSERLGPDTIALPFFRNGEVVNRKYRTISGDKEFSQDTGAERVPFNLDCLKDDTLGDQPFIITEGELDCLSAIQAGYQRCISVPDGAPGVEVGDRSSAKYDFLDFLPDSALAINPIILAVDNDNAGAALLADLSLRLGRARCKWVRYPKGCKDLNDALRLFGTKGVVETIRRAEWLHLDGVYRMSELPPLVPTVPHESGFPGLTEHYRLRLGDFCVVTGVPGGGKTTFVNDLVCRMVVRHKWPVCFASFEQIPQIDHRRNLRSWYGGGLVKDLDAATLQQADEWIDKNFVFLHPSEEDRPTLDWLLQRFSESVVRYGVRIAVLDPWNEIEHERPKEKTLTEYVGEALREFKIFARKHEIHLIVCAHPAKLRREEGKYPIPSLYDISDSAHWANRADVGIIVHRASEEETVIKVAKSRYHDQIGRPGDVSVRYVWERCQYEPLVRPVTSWQKD